MIHCLENREKWESGEKRITITGMPEFKIITIKEAENNLIYAQFSEMVKINGLKGNTYHLQGNYGIYESFLSYFNDESSKYYLTNKAVILTSLLHTTTLTHKNV